MFRNYMSEIELLVIGMAVAIAAAGIVTYVIFWSLRNAFAPVKRVHAKVERKHTKETGLFTLPSLRWWNPFAWRVWCIGTLWGRPGMMAPDEGNEISSMDYIVTFYAYGTLQELTVSEQTYINISEGDVGVLEYKGEKFVSFLPVNPVNTNATRITPRRTNN